MANKTTTIILTQNVRDLGKAGEQYKVSAGYARNFLLPNKLAVVATEKLLQQMEQKRVRASERAQTLKKEAEETAKSLAGKEVTMRMKAGQRGKLFGAVTAKDVARIIKDQLNRSIAVSQIELGKPIKTLGKHQVSLQLTPEVSAEVTLQVVSEKS